MANTESEGLSRELRKIDEKILSLSVGAEQGAETVFSVTAEKYTVLLLLTDYKVGVKNLKRILSNQDIDLKASRILVKRL